VSVRLGATSGATHAALPCDGLGVCRKAGEEGDEFA